MSGGMPAGFPLPDMRLARDHRIQLFAKGSDGSGARVSLPVNWAPRLSDPPGFPPDTQVLKVERAAREPGVLLLSIHRLPLGRYHERSRETAEIGLDRGIVVRLEAGNEVCWFYNAVSFEEGVDHLEIENPLFHQWDMTSVELTCLATRFEPGDQGFTREAGER